MTPDDQCGDDVSEISIDQDGYLDIAGLAQFVIYGESMYNNKTCDMQEAEGRLRFLT